MARPAMGGPGRRGQMAGGKRSKNPKKTLGRLLHYIRMACIRPVNTGAASSSSGAI